MSQEMALQGVLVSRWVVILAKACHVPMMLLSEHLCLFQGYPGPRGDNGEPVSIL